MPYTPRRIEDVSNESDESGGGRFSIVPGITIETSTMAQATEGAVTPSLPGQWNSSTVSLTKSGETPVIEALAQGNPITRYDESSDEQSMSSDDKPLQWRMINKRDTEELSSAEIGRMVEGLQAAKQDSQDDQPASASEEITPSSEDAVTKMINETVEGIERHGEEEKESGSRDEESSIRFVDDEGVTFKLETEIKEVQLDRRALSADDDRSVYDDDDEEEEGGGGEEEERGEQEEDQEEEEEEMAEQSSPSSIYHEPLQLDLLTLKFDTDSDLLSLFSEDGMKNLSNDKSMPKEHFSGLPYSSFNTTSPLFSPKLGTSLTLCKKENDRSFANTLPLTSPRPSGLNDFENEETTFVSTVRSLPNPNDRSVSPNPRSLFAGKGVYFSGPIRDAEPVKVVKEMEKPLMDFRLPPMDPVSTSYRPFESQERQWHDNGKSLQATAPSMPRIKAPALQLKITDEHFSCDMPRFDLTEFDDKKKEKALPPQPRPVLKSQFSSKMPPSEKLPEKPIKNDFSVTLINSASKGSEGNRDNSNPSFTVLRASEPSIEAHPTSDPASTSSSASIPVVAAHPQQKIPSPSTTHVKSPAPAAQSAVPLKKKEELEKPHRPPHPLSQSYSASDQEEERSLDHPRSSYIAKQLDRFKSSPSAQIQPLPQPSSSASRSDRGAQHSTTLVQPFSAGSTNRDMMHPSHDLSRDRLNSLSASDRQTSHHNQFARYLKEEDIEFVEEVPIVIEQSALFGVRRRLVGEFNDLGYKYTKVVKRKEDQLTSMGLADDVSSGSYTLRRMTLGPEKELREREELLEAREHDLTIEALSKAEMAYVKFEVWTEARQGRWMIKGPAQDQGVVADELPQIADVWALPIDSKGVVRRNKCKSNVELTSTKTIVRCPDCIQDTTGILYRRCAACHNCRLVEMVYNVQCTIRLAQFTPLTLPARLLIGNRQPHIYYIDTTDARQVRDILHDRAVEALQSAATRVVATHNAKHGSRLLMGRATVTRRGLLTVMVTSFKTKAKRVFDVQDGPDGSVNEVTELVCPKVTKRGVSPAPSSAFREGSFRHKNGSTTSLNSYDRGEDSIRSEKGRTLLSPLHKNRSVKEERTMSPLSSAAVQAPLIAPLPKRGWKAIFTR